MSATTFDVAICDLSLANVFDARPMSRKLAIEITGGLSDPSAMPGYAWGIPAEDCHTGSALAQIPGTPCFKCYARKRAYIWPAVRAAYRRRADRASNPHWIEAMVWLIEHSGDEYFRWFDSGDIQSVEQLRDIIAVCRALPNVHFWLPTQEYGIVAQFRAQGGVIPENLVIRLSARKIDGAPPVAYGLPTSNIYSHGHEPMGYQCQKPFHKNHCGPCRACWDKTVELVSYKEH